MKNCIIISKSLILNFEMVLPTVALELASMLLVVSTAGGMSLPQSCLSDRDCAQPDMYCYQSGKCASCTDCSLYKRFPGTACAKDKNQCGGCLPGMETEHNLDGTFTCQTPDILVPSTQMPGPEVFDKSLPVYLIVVIILVIVLLFCIAGYVMYKCSNSSVNIRNIFSICPNNSLMNTGDCTKCPENSLSPQPQPQPPPYTERNPTAPPFEDPPEALDPPIYQKVHRSVENEPSQTANAYSNPQYVRGGNLGTNSESEDPEEETEAAEDDALINSTSISHPDDEETQPSNWTPTPGSETGSTTGPTSFAGVLGFQQLRISQPDVTTTYVIPQGASNRSNSTPAIDFNAQSQSGNTGNTSPEGNTQINIIAHVGPVYISKTA